MQSLLIKKVLYIFVYALTHVCMYVCKYVYHMIYTCRLSLKNDLIVPESIVAKDTVEVCKIYV